jgi:hypothetical protein
MRVRRLTGCALALAAATAFSACGDGEQRVNDDRPAATINVTAAIIGDHLEVSPRRFGAGPIRLLVTNQTATPQAITFETDEIGGDSPGLTRTSAPIIPSGTTSLEVDGLREGAYRISTSDDAIEPVAVAVGAPRPSAQSELLQP